VDLFEKIQPRNNPFGEGSQAEDGFFFFPKLEGEISTRMKFRGNEVLTWSINNYLGLANHPEIRKIDADAAAEWGLASPMGARMMTGNTEYHERFEQQLAEFEKKEAGLLLNYGYQGVVSIIEGLVDRKDVIIYDSESHACIVDGVRLHLGKRFVYSHNDIAGLEKQLNRAEKIIAETGGAILVVTEGVFGMSGNLGNLGEIAELKSKYQFRLFVDDAHGFGTMGESGAGTGEALGVQDEIDVYFSTFAKSMASIGGFVTGPKHVIEYFRFTLRSQIFAKSLPMPFVLGGLKRFEMLKEPEHREKLWKIVNALQEGLKGRGFNLGTTRSPVTPVFLEGEWWEGANMVRDLRNNYRIFCSCVVYPVIPKGKFMLRLIPTASHTLDDVKETIEAFEAVKSRWDERYYEKVGLEGVL